MDFMFAVRNNDYKRVSELLQRYIRAGEEIPTAPLVISVEDGKYNMTKYLLERGANPNAVLLRGRILLNPAFDGHFGVIQLLLEHGLEPEQDTLNDILKLAAMGNNLEIIRYAVQHGLAENLGEVLFNAAQGGNIDIVRYLLDQGVDLNTRLPAHSHTLLTNAVGAAAMNGFREMVFFLLDEAGDVVYENALLSLVSFGRMTDVLRHFLAAQDWSQEAKDAALVDAALDCTNDNVRLLLAEGANANARSGLAFQRAIRRNCLETLALLVAEGGFEEVRNIEQRHFRLASAPILKFIQFHQEEARPFFAVGMPNFTRGAITALRSTKARLRLLGDCPRLFHRPSRIISLNTIVNVLEYAGPRWFAR